MAKDNEILKIQELKVIAEEAYQKYQEAVEKLYNKEGESKHIIEIEPTEEGKNWLRVTLVDNISCLQRGENIIGVSFVRPVGVKIEYLKNKPK